MKLGQFPQPSITTISTVVGWPPITQCTVSWIEAGWPGNGTTVGVVCTVVTSTVALVSRVNSSARSWLLPWAQAASRAVILVCKAPSSGATCTLTFGGGYGVGVSGDVWVGEAGRGVVVAVAVATLVARAVGVRVGGSVVTVAVTVAVEVAVSVAVAAIVAVVDGDGVTAPAGAA